STSKAYEEEFPSPAWAKPKRWFIVLIFVGDKNLRPCIQFSFAINRNVVVEQAGCEAVASHIQWQLVTSFSALATASWQA
ncbi:hypothetical protein GOODEAATRI_028967, partial [Goodea atripinnis]